MTRSARFPIARRSLAAVVSASLLLPAAGCQPKTDAGKEPATAAPSAAASDWKAKFAAAGLTGDAATPPGQIPADAVAKAKAGTLADVVKGLYGTGKLVKQPLHKRRRHAVPGTAALWTAVAAGNAQPVHPIEAAWLIYALAEARGEAAEFVLDTAGVQTPLMLTRTRIGVRVAGQIYEPFADQPMVQPKVVPQAQAAAWWLVIRAGAARMRGDFGAVYADLLAAETLHKPLAAAQFARGIAEIEQQLADKGQPTCEAALAIEEDPLARLFLAELALSQNAPVQALNQVEAALKASPDLPEALVTKALVQMQRLPTLPEAQKTVLVTETEALLSKALAKDSRVPGAHAARANLKLTQRDIPSAEFILREAIKTKGPAGESDLESTLLLASILSQQDKYAEALEVLTSAGAAPDDERFALALARTHAKLGALDKALEVAEKAYQAAPDNNNLALLRADMLRQVGRVPEAIAALEPLKKGSDGERVTLLQAQLFAQTGQFDKALPVLTEARKNKPEDKEVAALLLVTLAMAKKTDESLSLADELTKGKLVGTSDIAGLYLQVGAMEVAGQYLQRAIAAGAAEPEVWALYAMVLTASGKKDAALALKADAKKALKPEQAKVIAETIDKAIASAEAEMKQMQDQMEAARKAAPEGGAPPPAGPTGHEGHDHGHEGHGH